MYSNAIPVFELAVKMGSVTAMNNLGNLASMQKKYEEAAAWYRKVLELEPENQSAKANLNRVMSELEN
jgi:TPR repeat protein